VATPIAIKAVELVAGDLGVMLEADASLRDRAEATVRAVDLEVEAMKRAGELRSVNQAYRQHRRAHPWCAWFDNYRAGLIRAAADLASEQGSGFDRHAIDGARIDPA
jgi:hypothetical protein